MKGHLDALAKMIDENRSCLCLLDQSAAIQSSLKSLDTLIIRKFLRNNIQVGTKRPKKQMIEEIVEVFRRQQRREFI